TEETGALTITLNKILGARDDDPSRYAGEIEGYRRLNRELEVLETFEGRQWGITILGVPEALRPTRRIPLPPWFLWGGEKTGHPIGPDEDWPVEVWRGHDEPLTFCLPCLAGNPRVPAWVKRMRANGLITAPTQAELSHEASNAGRFSR
ncbi:MAG: hypothetical protein QGG40_17900, partial [Myxococcota bacterium]|nr:hypothetical protein [Myxococcota bacterium]